MYPSDYGYATSGGSTNNREMCLNYALWQWGNIEDCKNNNYIFDSSYYSWSLTHNYENSNQVILLYPAGVIGGVSASNEFGVKPVLYLDSSVMIKSGDGSEVNPYVLNI